MTELDQEEKAAGRVFPVQATVRGAALAMIWPVGAKPRCIACCKNQCEEWPALFLALARAKRFDAEALCKCGRNFGHKDSVDAAEWLNKNSGDEDEDSSAANAEVSR